MRVKGKIYSAIMVSTHPYGGLHDATSAFNHEDNLDGQSDKQGNTRTDSTAIYGRSCDQKESPVNWTPHEDVTRQIPKQVLYSQLFSGHRKRGCPHLRFKDTIKII
ncbi:hypothetical protein NP493_44g03000 [Ridgeia piscesae]|uniref:Uncharacterized protein n=1 Tax=Ridgeia piscesae TaxID=27915 RepID=A0AAD9PBU5_RIDPI|nr:hypothetical protein NP493_44g03000 [Ridgeia piscesae]